MITLTTEEIIWFIEEDLYNSDPEWVEAYEQWSEDTYDPD